MITAVTVSFNRHEATPRRSALIDDRAEFASASRPPVDMPGAHVASEEGDAVSTDDGPRILIVEDDYFVGLQNEDMLTKAGFLIIGIATTAEYALTLAAERKPDLVLMDIRLAHGGDGIDAAMKLLQRFGIRSIFATAHADPGTRSRAAAARPLGWVVKPFTAAALVKSVRDGLAAKRAEGGG